MTPPAKPSKPALSTSELTKAYGERPIVTVDLRAMDRVLEIDDVSLAARISEPASRAIQDAWAVRR